MADRAVKVYLKGDISDFNRAMLGAAATAKTFTNQLDTSTDRATNLTQSILAIGPALVPIGAAGVPALAGLTNELGFAAAGAGVAALAFSGVGDALKSVNDYAIDPTEAHLAKMNQTLAEIGPAGRSFVQFLQELRPQLQGLQDAAQAGFFPGLQEGMESLLTRLPQVERIVSVIATTMGDLAEEAGTNLASGRWDDFFTFLETEARPTLLDLGRSIGNFAEGLANLWMAFEPLSSDFSASFLGLSRDFSKWTDELDQTEGFQDFLAYVERVGPKVWETLGAIGNALLQIVEAAAPVGELALPVIRGIADAISALADSSIGPALIGTVAGIAALSRAISLLERANSGSLGTLFGASALGGAKRAVRDLPAASKAYLDFGAALDTAAPKVGKFATTSERLGASLRGAGTLGAGAALLGVSLSGLDDKLGATNTSLGAMAGLMVTGGPWGLAIGGAIGLMKDLNDASTSTAESLAQFDQTLTSSGDNLDAQVDVIDDYIAKVKKAQDASGIDLGDTVEGLEDLRASRTKQIKAAQDQAFAEAGLSSVMDGASDSLRDQTYELITNTAETNRNRDAKISASGGLVAFEQAIDDANAAAKRNGRTLDINTQAGRDNQTALDRLAASWNNLTPAQQNAEGASHRARSEFIRAAIQMGRNRTQARKLADQYLDIPDRVSTEVVLEGVTGAVRKLQNIKDRLLSLDGTTARTFVQIKESMADGGLVRRFDGGGYVAGPGGPREDLIPAMLSNGEFVVNAATTARLRPWLERENAKGYADGGAVQPQRMGSTSPSGTTTLVPLVASQSLVGARIAIDRDGTAGFVDGRVELKISAQQNYAASQRRAGR